jgi:hypothetical protein
LCLQLTTNEQKRQTILSLSGTNQKKKEEEEKKRKEKKKQNEEEKKRKEKKRKEKKRKEKKRKEKKFYLLALIHIFVQIRIAGYKGVVLYNRRLYYDTHESDGQQVPYKLALRPSMKKFTSNHYKFEVYPLNNNNKDTHNDSDCHCESLYTILS